MGALISLVAMLAGFIVLVVLVTRRSRASVKTMAQLERASFTAPVSSDPSSALVEMLGLQSSGPANPHPTARHAPELGDLEVATVTIRNGVWVCAELPREVAVPITFSPWKPTPFAAVESRGNRRIGVTPAARVDDERLGRTWLAWISPQQDPKAALDADPDVWPVVDALSSALDTAPAGGGADARRPLAEAAAPQGFKLGSRVSVSFRGRFVLIGPGARLTLARSSKLEDLERAAAFVVGAFTRRIQPT